ncbi:MAG: AbrB/MazE/SpoVT family DNA-binding domain-containing protein [Candidatus Magasanikbacteria bacterium]
MKKEAKITTKGQVTIPAPIREKLGLNAQDKIVFELVNGDLKLKPVTKKDFMDLAGSVEHKDEEIDFDELREKMEKDKAKEIIKEGNEE